MSAILSWKIGELRVEDACMKRLAKKPEMLRINIIRLLDILNILDIQVPRLLKKTEDKFANKPIKAISLCVSPVLLRNTPNMPP